MKLKALCVSIHDVAPATWEDCLVLHRALRQVAPALPLTWLVVPRYHGTAPPAPAMEAALARLLDAGHELALHGYTHVNSAARRPGLRSHFVRDVYTTGEGEFAAIDHTEALQRLDLGLAWFAERGWPVSGFVPPAWLASAGAHAAIRQRPFIYTTSLTHFHCLRDAGMTGRGESLPPECGEWMQPERKESAQSERNKLSSFGAIASAPLERSKSSSFGQRQRSSPGMSARSSPEHSVWSPSLMYTARHAYGRWLSPPLDEALALALSHSPLIRLALHPADARHPALLRHAQTLVARLLTSRVPMTKNRFGATYAAPASAMPLAAAAS